MGVHSPPRGSVAEIIALNKCHKRLSYLDKAISVTDPAGGECIPRRNISIILKISDVIVINQVHASGSVGSGIGLGHKPGLTHPPTSYKHLFVTQF